MKLLLMDSLGLLYRGHFAMLRSPLAAPDGTVTSGLSHLATEMVERIAEHSPSHAAAAFDSGEPGFRNAIHPGYKAHRPPMPPDLAVQTALAPGLMRALGVPVLEGAGWEADDLIASAAAAALAAGGSVLVVSADKDLLQLLCEDVSIWQPGRQGSPGRLLGPADVPGLLGVRADQVAEYLALAGDSSDNIPGAAGIGPKTASSLLSEYGSLAGVYDSLASIRPDSLRRKLEASREAVRMSLELTRLRFDAPLPGGLESLLLRPPAGEEAAKLLDRLGMRRLAGRLDIRRDAPAGLLSAEPGASPLSEDSPALVIGSREDGTPCAAVSGTRGDWLLEGDISEAWAIAARGGYSSPDSKCLARAALAAGRECSPAGLDTMLADHVASGGTQGRDLDRLASEMLGRSIPPSGTEALRHRAAVCRDLAPLIRAALDTDSSRLLEEVEYPLAIVLASMEHRGIELDMDSLAALGTALGLRAAELEQEAGRILGFPVNLRSSSQVSEILFKVLGLPAIRKTGRGGDSSGESVLQALSAAHPFVPLLAEHREVTKLLSTYAARLPDYVDRATGLVHTTFNQAVTATGRLSSANPNLQNIPIRTERGREIRRCFRGRHGEMLVSADYSQVELRMLAHLAGEGALREAFRKGSDIHASTAAALFGSVTPENRRRAKEVNFSIIYGISAHGLAQRLAVGRAEAASVISRYLETYPEVGGFHERCVSEVERTGCTRTVLGRRRRLGDLAGSSGQARRALERIAVNSTVQGSAADLVKLAMLRAHRALSDLHPRAGLVLQVHDEIVASCPAGEEDGVASVLSDSMTSAMELEVPLGVETGKGRNWLDAHG